MESSSLFLFLLFPKFAIWLLPWGKICRQILHRRFKVMASKVDMILERLPMLNKLLWSLKKEEITKGKNQKGTLERSQSAPPALAHVSFDGKLINRIQYHLERLKVKLEKLEQLQTNVGEELDRHLLMVPLLIRNHDSYSIKPDLQDMETKICDLLYQVPLLSGNPEKQKAAEHGGMINESGSDFYLPSIHTNVEDLIKREVFIQVIQKFMGLSFLKKMCLLSFAVFPENQEVHRTMLMYWWIGERILGVEGAEEAVEEVLKELTEKELIQPVEERRKVAPRIYKMSPFVHSSVVLLSEKIGLFDIYGQGKKPRMKNSEMGKVCLVKGSSIQQEAIPKKMPSRDHIETVFNVSERFPDFTFNWFSEHPSNRKLKLSTTWFKSLKVFYLGRWERSKKRHIQVQSPQLMQCLNHLKNLRILSFQGISSIRSLNSSVCKLHKLIVLDLRECYDLNKLPEKMDSLENLVYLDMTGCYMLEWIPLRLALLNNLEVLKGFVVCDEVYESVACKLSYLTRMTKLRKLSVEINRDDFGVEQLMDDLLKLKALTSLKVTWRRDLIRIIRRHYRESRSLPHQLKKLVLQRFPHKELPIWLHPRNLIHLRKLHIGGARKLKGFGDFPDKATECAVQVLRLTSLRKLRVDWIALTQIFPNLVFLENYECPRVTLTPCDGNGIWRSDED